MSLTSRLLALSRRFGAASRFVVTTALQTLVPGAPMLAQLAGTALEVVAEAARDLREEELIRRLQTTAEDAARLTEVLGVLQDDLGTLLNQLAALQGLPEAAQQILDVSVATDARTQAALYKLDGLAGQLDLVAAQNRRLLVGQEEMLPLLRRMLSVADFIEELRAGGADGRQLAELVRAVREGQAALVGGQTAQAERALTRLVKSFPRSGAAQMGLAAVEVVEHDLPGAQQALTRAVKLRPGDTGLRDLQSRATRALVSAGPAPGGTTAQAVVKPGDALDGWLLEARLGAGGWGQVFRARKGGQVRALKVMHAQLSADPAFVERFKTEIMTLAGLRGTKSLVEIQSFGFDAAARCWYFVMEYVQGVSLEAYLSRKGPIRASQARLLFARIAEGLAVAHERGVVHRDIKPANILLRSPGGEPVLVDFGLATLVEGSGRAGSSQVTGYTAVFAAPEQLRGRPADTRSDVYALAGSLHYALHYDLPDRREPIDFRPENVARDVRTVLERALAASPDHRPRDASAFAALLCPQKDAILEVEPIPDVELVDPVHDVELVEPSGRSAAPPETKGSRRGSTSARSRGARPSRPDESDVTRGIRYRTRVAQLLACYETAASIRAKPPRRSVTLLLGLILALPMSTGVAGIVHNAKAPRYSAYPGYGSGGSPMEVHYNESRRHSAERAASRLIAWSYVGTGAAVILGVGVSRGQRHRRKIRAAEAERDAKIEEIVRDFPEDLRMWGGRASLEDVDLVRQMCAHPPIVSGY